MPHGQHRLTGTTAPASPLLAGCLLTLSSAAVAKGGGHGDGHASVVHVNGHTTKTGTYVPPHYRTGADDSITGRPRRTLIPIPGRPRRKIRTDIEPNY